MLQENRAINNNNMDAAQDIIIESRTRSTGEQIYRKYLKGKLIGKGGFAKCFHVTDLQNNKMMAGKIVPKSSLVKPRAKQKLLAEIRIHRSLQHPHVVHFEHFFEDKENVYILLELCHNRSMMEVMKRRKRLSEQETAFFMIQIIDAVKYMHQNKVIHRDLKLGNLFVTKDMHIKIGDFGLATKLEHNGERKRTICGTPNYIAPEILEGKNGHSYEVDTWALGVILYTLIVGKPPFETSDVKSTYKRIKANLYSFPEHVHVSELAKSLIRTILNPVPEQRPSLDQILAHPWFTRMSIPTQLPRNAASTDPILSTLPTAQSVSAATATIGNAARGYIPQHSSYTPSNTTTNSNSVSASATTNASASASVNQIHSYSSSSRLPLTEMPSAANTNTDVQTLTARLSRMGFDSAASTTSSHSKQQAATCTSASAASSSTNIITSSGTLSSTATAAAAASSIHSHRPHEPHSHSHSHSHQQQQQQPQQPQSQSHLPTEPLHESEHPHIVADEDMDEEERKQLDSMHQQLELSIALAKTPSGHTLKSGSGSNPSMAEAPPQWVTKWVDYSNKYGLGYQLCNDSVGVYFNDATKIVLAADGVHVEYVEHKKAENSSQHVEDRRCFTLTDYPSDLHKKVTLLKHFRNYLVDKESVPTSNAATATATATASSTGNAKDSYKLPQENAGVSTLPFVKKWLRTRHAIIFRLSNKVVQVNFFDHTKLVLSSEQQMVTFINKQRERSSHCLANVVNEPVPELIHRLKYTKEILYQLITRNPSKSNEQQ